MPELQTLPQLAYAWNRSLDVLRRLVSKSPELRTLGTRIGPTRAFTPAEAETIKAAADAKRKPAAARAE